MSVTPRKFSVCCSQHFLCYSQQFLCCLQRFLCCLQRFLYCLQLVFCCHALCRASRNCSSTLCDVIEKSRAISCLAACNIGNASSKHEEMLSGVTDVISADFQFLHSILRPANTLHSNCRWCKHKANSLKANVSNESLFLNAALGSVDES